MEHDTRTKSKPLYQPVNINKNADFYLFVGEKEQSPELNKLFDDCSGEKKEIMFFDLSELLNKTDGFNLITCPDILSKAFSALRLLSEIYVSGTEAFIWDIQNFALKSGVFSEKINLISPTSSVRRVFCTHCYTVMENITHTPVVCEGCGLPLLVRDHFSRVHGAYVGLNINAEEADDIPAQRGFE
jgi:hypothetical protein